MLGQQAYGRCRHRIDGGQAERDDGKCLTGARQRPGKANSSGADQERTDSEQGHLPGGAEVLPDDRREDDRRDDQQTCTKYQQQLLRPASRCRSCGQRRFAD